MGVHKRDISPNGVSNRKLELGEENGMVVILVDQDTGERFKLKPSEAKEFGNAIVQLAKELER